MPPGFALPNALQRLFPSRSACRIRVRLGQPLRRHTRGSVRGRARAAGGPQAMDLQSPRVFFHRASRTAIVTDLVQCFDPDAMHGCRGWLMRLDGLVGPDGSTSRESRLSFLGHRAARHAKSTLLSWNPE